MVKLIWEGKSEKSVKLKELKNRLLNYYKIFEVHPEVNEQKIQNNLYKKDWRNKLFWGNNMEVLYHLLNNFKGKVDLIYIDPPFFSGTNYQIKIKDNDNVYNTIAYFDHWDKNLDSYLQMLYERIILFKELLSHTGLLFIHLDWHASHYVRLILDEIFGEERFINNIIWYYYNKYSAGKRNLPRAHDNILVYSKSKKYTFNELRIPREKPEKQLKREMINGVLKNVKDKNGHVKYRIVTDKKVDDVWRIPCMQPASKEWSGFPTQKHHKLLERIIKLGSNEKDLIADFFCGSGTTLLVADKLNRKWIGCDISAYSIYLSRRRILNFHNRISSTPLNIKPFEMLTNFTEEHKKIINSGFFEKEIIIGRKN